MCFILYILCSSNLCSSLRDSFEFRCDISVVALVVHYCSSSVMCSWKCVSKLLRWTPLSFFMRYSVRVVGDLIQSVFVILGMFSAPPYLASICCMRPL
jgi:hypothetical protein